MTAHKPDWPAPNNIRAFYTSTTFTNSQDNFGSFNLATHVNDQTTQVENNRARLKQLCNLPREPLWLNQTHSNHVHIADAQQGPINADASFSRSTDLVCAVLTADCVPILLCNKDGNEIAAIHAGWRGLATDIIANTITQFRAPNNTIIAWIGPCISQNSYEINEATRTCLLQNNNATKAHFQTSKAQHFYACLASIAKYQLHTHGIKHVYLSQQCTYTDYKFYSYRRSNVTGRQACGIWIAPR
jgi:polyphenol oxidase